MPEPSQSPPRPTVEQDHPVESVTNADQDLQKDTARSQDITDKQNNAISDSTCAPPLVHSPSDTTIAARRRASSAGSGVVPTLQGLKLSENPIQGAVPKLRRLVWGNSSKDEHPSAGDVGYSSGVLHKDSASESSSESESIASESDSDSSDEEDDNEKTDEQVRVTSASSSAKGIITKPEPNDDDYVPSSPQSKLDLSKDAFAIEKQKQKKYQNLTPQDIYDYEIFRTKMIYPATAFDTDGHIEDEIPYTSVNEEAEDAKKAATLTTEISQICSDQEGKRMFRAIERGNLPALNDLTEQEYANTKSYLICTDLSPEALHALEWTIGTIIRDGNVLFAVCAFDDDSADPPPAQEGERLDACQRITECIVKLLKKTRLQVHVVVEVIHSKSPKHLITEIIDYISPTLVIMGSRGRSSLKGVLLGSFSNYILERSSVPVMVARRKLHKMKHKDLNVRLANNLRPPMDFGEPAI